MIRIEALPAGDGDCLWIEWPDTHGATHRMLVDGGRGYPRQMPTGLADRLARQPADQRAFDVVVCTHIDADHIGGLLALFDDPPRGFRAADVWFNGRRHLDVLGPAQGDGLSALLTRHSVPWNLAFSGAAVAVPRSDDLPVVDMPGLRLTLLSPTRSQLAKLARSWPRVLAEAEAAPALSPPDVLRRERADREIELHRLLARPYTPDTSAANGSSIAFLVEGEDGGRILFSADAAAEVLAASLRRITTGARYRVDLCKLPHHGSRHNTNRELLSMLDCRHWLISTSGHRHGHPHREAMAKILCGPDEATAWFNYRSLTTEEYGAGDLSSRYGFSAKFPEPGPGIALWVGNSRVERAS